MKLEDMILVVENRKGTETMFLLGLSDYMEMVLKACEDSAIDIADAVQQLYDTKKGGTGWSELYFRTNKSSQARFCVSKGQLQGELLGVQENGIIGVKPEFDEERCNPECLEVLRAHGIDTDGRSSFNSLHYEAVDHHYHIGEIVDNLNGSSYRVMELFSPENLLLMSVDSGEMIVGVNTQYYKRTPKEGYSSPDSVICGIEWGQGVYLGNRVADISYESLRQSYGISPKQETLTQFRERLKREFRLYDSISESESLVFTIKEASRKSLDEKFGTQNYDEFYGLLDRGYYDGLFKGITQDERQKEIDQLKQGKVR